MNALHRHYLETLQCGNIQSSPARIPLLSMPWRDTSPLTPEKFSLGIAGKGCTPTKVTPCTPRCKPISISHMLRDLQIAPLRSTQGWTSIAGIDVGVTWGWDQKKKKKINIYIYIYIYILNHMVHNMYVFTMHWVLILFECLCALRGLSQTLWRLDLIQTCSSLECHV